MNDGGKVPTLAHYIDPYFIFKLTIFKILVCLVFCCSTASYSVTFDCSIRISHMTVVFRVSQVSQGVRS